MAKTYLVIVLTFLASLKGFGQDPHQNPNANFEVYNFCFGNLVHFQNTSTSHMVPDYTWNIYQQGIPAPVFTSTLTDIDFQFPVKTTYTVELIVINYVTPTHFHSDQAVRVINMDSALHAGFGFQFCQSQFANMSTCANSFLWNFGDGDTSTLKSPVHYYSTYTQYTVTLIAYSGSQSDTCKQEITPFPNMLTGNFNTTMDGDTVRFKAVIDTLKAAYVDWEWDYGDGSDADIYGKAGMKVKHRYPVAEKDSVYIVTLLEKDGCFAAASQQNVLIKGVGRTIKETKVFPNPLESDLIQIETEKKDELVEIKVYDKIGKLLKVEVTDSLYGYYVNAGSFSQGLYIVQLIFSDETKNYKIIKQ